MTCSLYQGQAGADHAACGDASASTRLNLWLGARGQPCALFLDVDGTLLDFAESPTAVQVPGELRNALDRLHRLLGGALALVSGRSVAVLDQLFAPLRLPACGGHGAHWRVHAEAPLHYASDAGLADSMRQRLQALAERHAGVLVEDKGSSLALHYRAAPAAGPLLATALRALLAGTGLRLLPGKMVLEVIGHEGDKAQAIQRFLRLRPFAGRRPLFIGDDVTDQPALALMPALGGLALSVGCLLPGAQAAFADPAEVRAALIGAAARLGQ
jgi:trehalose 6-phosphate phosphatase